MTARVSLVVRSHTRITESSADDAVRPCASTPHSRSSTHAPMALSQHTLRDRKGSLNDGQTPISRGLRVHASTGYHRCEGNRRASRNGRVSDLPPEIPSDSQLFHRCTALHVSLNAPTAPSLSLSLHLSLHPPAHPLPRTPLPAHAQCTCGSPRTRRLTLAMSSPSHPLTRSPASRPTPPPFAVVREVRWRVVRGLWGVQHGGGA